MMALVRVSVRLDLILDVVPLPIESYILEQLDMLHIDGSRTGLLSDAVHHLLNITTPLQQD